MGSYGIFLLMGNAGFISSTVWVRRGVSPTWGQGIAWVCTLTLESLNPKPLNPKP